MLIRYACSMGNKLIGNASWFQAIALLVVRLWIAEVFFMSGLTKIKSWNTTVALFADEYKVPVLSPEIAAYITTTAELVLPMLLILGLMTPLSALGLMGMTLVIELFVVVINIKSFWRTRFTFVQINGAGVLARINIVHKCSLNVMQCRHRIPP